MKIDYPLAKPLIVKDDIDAVINILTSGQLVQGEAVRTFENKLSKYIGNQFGVMTSNGTSSLFLALKSLGIEKGDEVIIPSFSFVATANVVELIGAIPVFVDIDINSLNIDIQRIEEKISNKTKAIMPVHEFGYPANMDVINQIANKYNLSVIEDAACALGTKYKGKYAGGLSTIGSFSFHPRKSITSGEGGALMLNDEKIFNTLKAYRNHGFNDETGSYSEIGFNYRMTDIQASLLNSQFNRLESIIQLKRDIVSNYIHEINRHDIDVKYTIEEKGYIHSWQTFHLILPQHINRDSVIMKLKNHGIGSNYGAQCIPALKYYFQKYHHDIQKKYNNSVIAYNQGLALPLYEELKPFETKFIIETLATIIKEY